MLGPSLVDMFVSQVGFAALSLVRSYFYNSDRMVSLVTSRVSLQTLGFVCAHFWLKPA